LQSETVRFNTIQPLNFIPATAKHCDPARSPRTKLALGNAAPTGATASEPAVLVFISGAGAHAASGQRVAEIGKLPSTGSRVSNLQADDPRSTYRARRNSRRFQKKKWPPNSQGGSGTKNALLADCVPTTAGVLPAGANRSVNGRGVPQAGFGSL
jgi:hypothetical protein